MSSTPAPSRLSTVQTALVTGSSRGIGRGIARRLAADGVLVCIHYGSGVERATETVEEIEAAGGQAFALGHDLGDDDPEGFVTALRHELSERTGLERLDILVNNAATARPLPFAEVTPEVYDRIFDVNVRGHFFLTQALLPLLARGGRIVTISSATCRVMVPGTLAYTMGKSALETMSWWLATDLASRGITVNVVSPGVIATELAQETMGEEGMLAASTLSPFGRVGEVEDVVEVVAFLVSDGARWVTGQVLDASGGQSL